MARTESWILEKVLKFASQFSSLVKVWKMKINSGKWLTVWSVCFLSQNCIAICYFTFACHHGKTLILFLSVFLSTALLNNALFGKDSSV